MGNDEEITDVALIDSDIETSTDEKIDELELRLKDYPTIECPLVHRFTPGLYIREIFMPAGSMITSKIHKTEHPYVVSKGKVSVFTDNDGEILIEAPFTGITKPGTRRVLYNHEDTIWITFHPVCISPLDDTIESITDAVNKIEGLIIEKHDNVLLDNETKNRFDKISKYGLSEINKEVENGY